MTCTLVAGVGNALFGDDAFGCAVAQALSQRSLPSGVKVKDFGVRTLDLAYALLEGVERVIFVDSLVRGRSPGTLCLLSLDVSAPFSPPSPFVAHGLGAHEVLARAFELGARVSEAFLVGCEPESAGDEFEPRLGLSEPVRAAVGEAVRWVEQLLLGELPLSLREVEPACTKWP